MGNVTLSREVMTELEKIKGRGSHSDTILRLIKRHQRIRKDSEFVMVWHRSMDDLHKHIASFENKVIPENFFKAINETTTYKALLSMSMAFLKREIADYFELPDIY